MVVLGPNNQRESIELLLTVNRKKKTGRHEKYTRLGVERAKGRGKIIEV